MLESFAHTLEKNALDTVRSPFYSIGWMFTIFFKGLLNTSLCFR